ncbi:MAG: hypothetical protein RI947_1474 [Candidatus Parcubacteria bacterium]|jgi:hypothetical protein
MGNLQRQQGRFCRSSFRQQTRLLIEESRANEADLFYDWLDALRDEDELYARYAGWGDGLFESLLEVAPMWFGTVCACGHGPNRHYADTRMCSDPDCETCDGYEVPEEQPYGLRSREAGEGYYGQGSYHSNGRPDIFDRYFDMLDE